MQSAASVSKPGERYSNIILAPFVLCLVDFVSFIVTVQQLPSLAGEELRNQPVVKQTDPGVREILPDHTGRVAQSFASAVHVSSPRPFRGSDRISKRACRRGGLALE